MEEKSMSFKKFYTSFTVIGAIIAIFGVIFHFL